MLCGSLQPHEFAEGVLKRLDIELSTQREVIELVDLLEAFELEDRIDRHEDVVVLRAQRPGR